MLRTRCVLFLAFLTAVLAGCDGSDTTGPGGGSTTDLGRSPRADEEAEWAAVWLSGALAAPDSLYRGIHDDLLAVRTEFRESYPIVDSLTFVLPWPPTVEVEFQAPVREEIRQDAYRDWDEMNGRFGLAAIDTLSHFPGSSYLTLSFSKRLHPMRLADYYLTLRGVTSVGYPLGGGAPMTLYPLQVDDRRVYLFRNCTDLCEEREYWYFRMGEQGPEFAGYYDGRAEEPAWWEEVLRGLETVGTGK